MLNSKLVPKHRIIHLKNNDRSDEERIKLFVQVPMVLGWIEQVRFVASTNFKRITQSCEYVRKNGEYAEFEAEFILKTCAVYYYYISFVSNGQYNTITKKGYSQKKDVSKDEFFKLSIGFKVPSWAKGAVMYHIFVDRFARDDSVNMPIMPGRVIKNWNEKPEIGPLDGKWNIDFFGGNLKGIIGKLDYIKSLGVSILYLSPIVRRQSNHRYDTADYETVDPYVGENCDLEELCRKAHQKQMRVVLDAVFNHTGNDSRYFNEYGTYDEIGAFQSKDSKYYNFYKRYWSSYGSQFSYWWGMTNLPECDSASNEWRQYITGEGGIIDKWFSLGIDGLRLDVADELSDEFIYLIRDAVHRNKKDGLVLGEVWKNPMRMNRGYLSSGKGLDTVMDYLLVDALIRYYKYKDVWKLETTLMEILLEYPEDTVNSLMNFTSTHDISRIIEILGCNAFQRNGEWAWNLSNDSKAWIKAHKLTKEEYDFGRKILKSFLVVLSMLPGTFSIFYGDEIGLEGIGNLANRAPFTWQSQDEEILEVTRKVGMIKSSYASLKEAECRIIEINERFFMFKRDTKEEEIFLIIASRTHLESRVSLNELCDVKEVLFSTHGEYEKNYVLRPYEAIILKVTRK